MADAPTSYPKGTLVELHAHTISIKMKDDMPPLTIIVADGATVRLPKGGYISPNSSVRVTPPGDM